MQLLETSIQASTTPDYPSHSSVALTNYQLRV